MSSINGGSPKLTAARASVCMRATVKDGGEVSVTLEQNFVTKRLSAVTVIDVHPGRDYNLINSEAASVSISIERERRAAMAAPVALSASSRRAYPGNGKGHNFPKTFAIVLNS